MKSFIHIQFVLLLSMTLWDFGFRLEAGDAAFGRQRNTAESGSALPDAIPRVRESSPPSFDRRGSPAGDLSSRYSVTHHAIEVEGRQIQYRATAGYMPIRGDSDKLLANIFFVAYELEDADVPAGRKTTPESGSAAPPAVTRPITFAFNGGPGASAVWLHVGALGPKRAVLGGDGTALPESDTLVDNEYTWLEFTDLVFVDPVGTGFSRAAPGVNAGQFYEVKKDIEISAEFIRLFVTRYERWLSPQFIVGESYGTTRAAGMARHLQENCGLYVDGLILLSSALNMAAISFDPGNDLPYVLSLPSYTAVARYHGVVTEKPSLNLGKALERVRAWALEEYTVALALGSTLPQTQFRETAKRLAEYTGLPEETIVQNRLRISNFDFVGELLERQRRVLGLLDGRVTTGYGGGGQRRYTDPSFFVVKGPFVTTFNNYVRTELGFKSDLAYIFLSNQANASWNWSGDRPGYLNLAPRLAETINLDNHLRVFAAAGYYDLTTPWLSQEYVLDHLELPANLRTNITFQLYPSGHQIYTSTDALRRLTNDVRAFVTAREAQ